MRATDHGLKVHVMCTRLTRRVNLSGAVVVTSSCQDAHASPPLLCASRLVRAVLEGADPVWEFTGRGAEDPRPLSPCVGAPGHHGAALTSATRGPPSAASLISLALPPRPWPVRGAELFSDGGGWWGRARSLTPLPGRGERPWRWGGLVRGVRARRLQGGRRHRVGDVADQLAE